MTQGAWTRDDSRRMSAKCDSWIPRAGFVLGLLEFCFFFSCLRHAGSDTWASKSGSGSGMATGDGVGRIFLYVMFLYLASSLFSKDWA